MKQAVAVTNCRFVQRPITSCLFEIPSVTNLPFRPFIPIAEQMDAQGGWISPSGELADVLGSEGQAHEAQGADPLLALAGTLECEVTDIGERHDDYIGDTLLQELRGNNEE